MSPQVRDALILAVTLAAGELEGSADRSLRRSAAGAHRQVRQQHQGRRPTGKNSITGRVYSKDVRAHLFEFGGTTPPHDIEPKNARALLLQMRGGNVFAASVHHPGGVYEARNIIHSAFDEMRAEIVESLEKAVLDVAGRASEE